MVVTFEPDAGAHILTCTDLTDVLVEQVAKAEVTDKAQIVTGSRGRMNRLPFNISTHFLARNLEGFCF